VLGVGIISPPFPAVLEAGCEGDRPGGNIEQITIEMEISQWQLKLAGVMQGNIHPAKRGLSVATEESQGLNAVAGSVSNSASRKPAALTTPPVRVSSSFRE